MEKAGASPENIERELAKLPPAPPVRVIEMGEEDEGPAIGLFFSLDTQWKTAGLAGVRTGLDYNAIRPAAEMLGIELTPRIFLDLRLMEGEQLKIDAERACAK